MHLILLLMMRWFNHPPDQGLISNLTEQNNIYNYKRSVLLKTKRGGDSYFQETYHLDNSYIYIPRG